MPYCDNTYFVDMPAIGAKTKMLAMFEFPCICKPKVRLAQAWNNTKHVPVRFRDVRMTNLQPIEDIATTVEVQEKVIEFVQKRQHDSYFMYGPAESGKTHIMSALYRVALERYIEQADAKSHYYTPAVFRVHTGVLLDEIMAYKFRKPDDEIETPLPTVTVGKVQSALNAGFNVALFLDEFDKHSGSEFALNELGKIIDVVWANNGQLVATANTSGKEMAMKWDKHLVATAVRRIGKGDTAHTINFGNPTFGDEDNEQPTAPVQKATIVEPEAVESEEDDTVKAEVNDFDTCFKPVDEPELPISSSSNTEQTPTPGKPTTLSREAELAERALQGYAT